MSLTKRTVKGITWLTSASVIEKVIQTCTTIVLARILGPADFGLFALAFVAMRGMYLFRSFGFDTALIRQKEQVDEAASTAFCIIPAMGVVIFIVLYFLAPWLAVFFENEALMPIVRIMGMIFVIGSVTRVPAALLEKDMQFRKLAVIDVLTAVMFTSMAIPFAFAGFGVLSLVLAYVLKIFCRMLMILFISKWRPRFYFDKKLATEMFHFGKYRFLESILNYFNRNTDNIMIGKLLGVVSLGYYNIAYNFAHLLGRYFLGKVNKVLFPAFSQIQGDDSDFRRVYLKSVFFLSLLSIPFATGVYFFSDDIIKIIYGSKWLEAIPILKILVLGTAVSVIGSSIGSILLAKGKSKEVFYLGLINTIIYVVVVIPCILMFGLKGAAIAYVVTSIAGNMVGWRFLHAHIQLKLSRVFNQFKLPVLYSMAMGAVAFVVQSVSAVFRLK